MMPTVQVTSQERSAAHISNATTGATLLDAELTHVVDNCALRLPLNSLPEWFKEEEPLVQFKDGQQSHQPQQSHQL